MTVLITDRPEQGVDKPRSRTGLNLLQGNLTSFGKKKRVMEDEPEARQSVRESETPAYFPWVKPGVTASTSQIGLPLAGTALSLLLPACPEVTWPRSRATDTHRS